MHLEQAKPFTVGPQAVMMKRRQVTHSEIDDNIVINKSAGSVGSALFKVFCDIGFTKIIQSDNYKESRN